MDRRSVQSVKAAKGRLPNVEGCQPCQHAALIILRHRAATLSNADSTPRGPVPIPTASPEVVELGTTAGPASKAPWREGGLWLAAAAMMLFIGILKGINLVIVMAYLLAGLWVINLVLARRAIRGLSARRLPRPPVQAGVPTEWVIEVRDDGPPAGSWVLEERVRGATAG